MQNQEFIDTLGVMDLISEKHKKMRSELMRRVEELLSEKVSDLDIYLLILTRHSSMSISESARNMSISRQGAHKHAKRLQELGFVQLADSELSRREKLLVLTPSGKEVCVKIDELKKSIELELEAKIGKEAYGNIKMLFRQDW